MCPRDEEPHEYWTDVGIAVCVSEMRHASALSVWCFLPNDASKKSPNGWGLQFMESDSTQSWLILSRASKAQELAQEVPRPVASYRKGPGLRHRLSPWVVFTARLYDEPVLLAVLPCESSAGPPFKPSVPAVSQPPCSARVKMTEAQSPLSEGLQPREGKQENRVF